MTLTPDQRRERMDRFAVAINDAASPLATELGKALKTSTQGVEPEFWRAVLMSVVRKRPELIIDCKPESFVAAVRRTAQLGLMPDPETGHVYFVPFNDGKAPAGMKECQLIVGYKGLIELCARTKNVEHVVARVVFAGDEFHYAYGINEVCAHTPSTAAKKGREVTHAYAICRFKDRSPIFVVVDRSEIEAIRSRSKVRNGGPWVNDFAAMCAKTAVRQLARWLPMDNPIRRQLELQMQEEEDYEAPRDVDAEGVATHNFSAALAARMRPADIQVDEPQALEGGTFEPVEDEPWPKSDAAPQAEPEPVGDEHDSSPVANLFAPRAEPELDPAPKRKR